ncbi:hypothetical protein C2G38_2012042 [Gigaspora rosea]|uniref:Protein kinase domain-containing protein n=1 Tax=Gigaspora rosea TaxID=44941 RepID=A0A397W0I9_9GLOM|nr:hypothetical protein C2G38_2012042 [Gigaspora rosea]
MAILEYVDGGTLRQYLEQNFNKMKWNDKLYIAKQIANAIKHLHDNNIIHGNLNSENIFIHKGSIKISSLSSQSFIEQNQYQHLLSFVQYFDPQYLQNLQTYKLDQSSDIYSIGVLFWEISSGTIPFESESPFGYDCLIAIIHGKRESEVIGTPREYSLIYKDCWCHDANKRPSIQYVVTHLNKIVIIEDFEEYAMEEDEIQLDQVDQRITTYKIDDQHSLLQALLQLFITLFNTTTNSIQIINNLFNYFEVHQIDPSLIFNQLAYQDYNFSMIGYFHEHGIGTDVDYHKAFWMYKLSSEIDVKNIFKNNLDNLSLLDNFNINNYIIGKISLGLLYSVGKGVNMDKPLAFKLFLDTAEIGFNIGQYYVASCYLCDDYVVEKDYTKSFEWYLKSAEGGNSDAQIKVAKCYMNGIGVIVDKEKAFDLYLKFAEKGNNDAICELANCYMKGIVIGMDRTKAFDLYSKSATSGNSDAQFELANCYANGICTSVNKNIAFDLYSKSANNGNINAIYELAKCYADGIGTIKNKTKAFEWYMKSAELNNPDAFYTVGFCYEHGLGTEVDKMKALEWYLKSTKQGNNTF